MTNSDIARRLMTYARQLDAQGGNLYRVRAFRAAAMTLERMDRPVEEILHERGRPGLEAIPGVGKSLAYSVEILIRDGELKTVIPADSVREPERLFESLPGVGKKLAEDLRDRLGLRTLDELQTAAESGRLTEVGVGPKRLAGIMAALRERMGPAQAPKDEPALADLLAVDAEYLAGMEAEELPCLTPRKFNPDGERWLGIHISDRDGWKLKAMFSNTALAHRLGRTHDWVVVYFEKGETRGQRTVVTETQGDLAGRRVVRGRECECRAHYGVRPMSSEPAA
jgi:DNA polymerase (family 10)